MSDLPAVSRTVVLPVTIHFGDCDPAGIVFYPNFLRWMDASSLHFFMQCGLPPWRELVKTRGIVGTPLLELQNIRFLTSATYGEHIEVRTCVLEWREKVFIQRHVVTRGDTVLCEGTEVRAFVRRDAENPDRLRAMPVPADIRALCAPDAAA